MRVVVRLRRPVRRHTLVCALPLLSLVGLALSAEAGLSLAGALEAETWPVGTVGAAPPFQGFWLRPELFPFPSSAPIREEGAPVPIAEAEPPTSTPMPEAPPATSTEARSGAPDVVVLHATLADVLPDTPELLPEGPVYTIYLNVGDETEWVMHYAVAAPGQQDAGPIVQIGNSGVVSPPAVRSSFLPPDSDAAPRPSLLLQGVLGADGFFESLEAGGDSIGQWEPLLAAVRQWRFRPARRDGRGVAIRVLLSVPAAHHRSET